MVHKILVAIDQSEMSSQVFEQAIALAKDTHASLMLLHVLAPFEKAYSSASHPGINGAFFGVSQTAQRYLEHYKALEQESIEWLRLRAAEAQKAGVEPESTHSVGEPGSIICTLAQTWGADLIIVGRRGLSELSELFIGSVSNYVLHHAPCSVLVVQQPPLPSQEATQQEQVTVKADS